VPVYDYVCSACGRVTEVIHGIDAEGPRFCPACGAEGTLHKGFNTPAVHFKGSGWAKKDRASNATRASARSGGDTKVDAESTGSTGSKDESGGSGSTAADSSSSLSSKDGSTASSDHAAESGGSKEAGPLQGASSPSKSSGPKRDRGGD
jgi:putative FmdB family regulatory protein